MGDHSYRYEALSSREIRVLRLLPGHGEMPLEAEVETRTLHLNPGEDAVADFDALSYVWGTGGKSSSIRVNGAPLAITDSLSSFLHRIRPATESRVLWADAICINQDDIEEKSLQIRLMAIIYRTARRVLVDLGEESEDSSLAVDLLDRVWKKHIWSGLVYDMHGNVLSPEIVAIYLGVNLPDRAEALADELPPDDSPQWISTVNFFRRAWFTRIWVVQEFVLARQPILMCGKTEIEWQSLLASCFSYRSGELPTGTVRVDSIQGRLAFIFMAAVRQIRHHSATEEGRRFLAEELPSGHLWEKFQTCRLIDMLHYFSISDATVAKDRYYAIVNIASDVDGAGDERLNLNYEMPLHEVISRVGRLLVQNKYGEEMLARAGLWQRTDPRIPSWVQDFGRPQSPLEMMDRTVLFQGDEVTGGLRFHAGLVLPDESSRFAPFLMVQGALLDVVDNGPFQSHFSSESLVSADILRDACDYLSKAFKALFHREDNIRYFNGDHVLDAIYDTILSGIQVTMKPREGLMKGFLFAAWLAFERKGATWDARKEWVCAEMERRYGTGREELVELLIEFISSMGYAYCFQYKQPVRTRRGYYTTLPSCFQVGDQVWIVKGCQPPLLLRKSKQYPGCHELVGSCYVHGFMKGEALKSGGLRFEQVSLH
ncbi:heterokaryon incompatibility protein-domain-containing protein [Cercophora newfieldiana]|uniref:Heterokaryon incompatibility protein-domain-containing protein n=1 Tax=Cercophora newfieldiana TaxID=92897 RepID=A0AA39YQD7_9PEZI|nr:heterokaryon incompatibility protein-domain-containing protein [Cercophora newfieldiana]